MTTITGTAWEEPPAQPQELALADLLDRALDWIFQGKIPSARSLLAGMPDLIEQGERLLDALLAILGPGRALREQSLLLESDLLALAADGGSAAVPTTDPGWLPDPFPGEFRVRRRLGAGAFGTVWLAEDLHLARYVALKTVRPPDPPELAARWLEQLRGEARVLASVRHRNVVQVYAWRETPAGEHYLVLQYVPGGSLADRVRQEGPLPWAMAARYIADVAEGLLAVHARGVVHRDVKPANILWNPETDEALLTDFGISARMSDRGEVGGTLFYMPPEAFDGVVSPSQDVYGLAASLFWLVTGSVPFPGRTTDEVLSRVRRGLPTPDARCVDLPAALERLIRDGLAAERSRRPSLLDFAAALRSSLNQLLADSLLRIEDPVRQPSPRVRLIVSRRVGRDTFVPMAASYPTPERFLRDLRVVPRDPERVDLRTGDVLRIEAEADRAGFLTVFNVGPTGNLNPLLPAALGRGPPLVEPGRLVPVLDVELTPPAGRERLFALWTREPLPLDRDELHRLAEDGELPVSGPYRATRNMARVQDIVGRLGPSDWQAAVLELDHHPC
jgi:serine/threonine protein kinase